VNEKKIVVVVSSLDDLCPLYLLLYDEESLAQCWIIFVSKYLKSMAHWFTGTIINQGARGLGFKSLKLIRWTKKTIVVVVSFLDDLCPLYLLLYNEESLKQYGIFLKFWTKMFSIRHQTLVYVSARGPRFKSLKLIIAPSLHWMIHFSLGHTVQE
jgi:hypothetical protein